MERPFRSALWQKVGKAIADYRMIEEGDRIAIGLSGGKDSLTLVYVLAGLRKIAPVKFKLLAITLDLGWDQDLKSRTALAEFCQGLGIPWYVEETRIGPIIFEERRETNPCALCARMRRGVLHRAAKRLNCNKVALGHHADDAIETLLLSLFYEGRIKSFLPVTHLDRQGITLIRPMVYVLERTIREVAKTLNFPVITNPCPANGRTRRQEVKEVIDRLEATNPNVREIILGALQNVDLSHLWQKAPNQPEVVSGESTWPTRLPTPEDNALYPDRHHTPPDPHWRR
ncbi:MAG: ATP-binding protein [Syntrophothermus sp.]